MHFNYAERIKVHIIIVTNGIHCHYARLPIASTDTLLKVAEQRLFMFILNTRLSSVSFEFFPLSQAYGVQFYLSKSFSFLIFFIRFVLFNKDYFRFSECDFILFSFDFFRKLCFLVVLFFGHFSCTPSKDFCS